MGINGPTQKRFIILDSLGKERTTTTKAKIARMVHFRDRVIIDLRELTIAPNGRK